MRFSTCQDGVENRDKVYYFWENAVSKSEKAYKN